MADGFQLARLIPVSGISNNTEAEMRATSALLSVLTIVRDFSVAMLSPLGASTARKASVEAFIETKFNWTMAPSYVQTDSSRSRTGRRCGRRWSR
jgi:hypothetical protein